MQTLLGGDENDTAVGLAFDEARDAGAAPIASAGKPSLDDQAVVVLGSGNLGLDLPDGGPSPPDASRRSRRGTHGSSRLFARIRTSALSSPAPGRGGPSRLGPAGHGISTRIASKARTRSGLSR